MNNLSLRLSTIASLVPKGAFVCDVGTDHGFLPIFLMESGIARGVIATDINEKPLKKAEENLKKTGAKGITLRLCDGLSGVKKGEVNTVIIAGMGGEVISGIIDRAPFLRDGMVELILQPTTAAKELRRYLAKNGFAVEQERALAENGKIYSVMLVRFCGAPYTIDDTQAAIGILKPDCDEAVQYIEKQYKIASNCANNLKKVSHKQNEYNYYFKLSEELKNILGG